MQLAEKLLVYSKYEIIISLLKIQNNYSAIKFIQENIDFFSIAPCEAIVLKFYCLIFGKCSLLLFLIALSKVIAPPTIAIEINYHFL